MKKYVIYLVLLVTVSSNAWAITPTLTVIREINFGVVMPVPGSCRMFATTGVITSYIGQNICVLNETAQNGRYTITANPNKMIRVKILPNLDTGDGIVFNVNASLQAQGETSKSISNNIGYVEINSGVTGVVDIYMGGTLIISNSYAYGQTVNFSFPDAIDWYEVP